MFVFHKKTHSIQKIEGAKCFEAHNRKPQNFQLMPSDAFCFQFMDFEDTRKIQFYLYHMFYFSIEYFIYMVFFICNMSLQTHVCVHVSHKLDQVFFAEG